MNIQIYKPKTFLPFVVPLLFQIGLIMAIPSQAVYTRVVGKTVILQTIPVDPYDFLRGYSQTLRYDISNRTELEKLPGAEVVFPKDSYVEQGSHFYVILESPTTPRGDSERPTPWKAIAVSLEPPSDLPENQVAIEGVVDYNWVDYGLETYYMPEDQREDINGHINEISGQSGQERPFVVEVKVDSSGNAVPLSLWVGDRNYNL